MNESFPTITAAIAEDRLADGKPSVMLGYLAPDFVEWALAHNTHNRHLCNKTVRDYAEQMTAGKWPMTNNGIGFTKSGFLADGQHRLHALKAAGYPRIPMIVQFGQDDDSQLVIDRQKIRNCAAGISLTSGIYMNSQQAGTIPWLYSIDTEQNAIKNKLDPFDFREVVIAYKDSIFALFGGEKRKGFTSAFYAPLVYLHAHGESMDTISTYLEGISTGECLEKGDPRLRYRILVVESTSGLSRGQVARELIFSYSTQLFLAFAEGRKVYSAYKWPLAKAFDELRKRAKSLANG